MNPVNKNIVIHKKGWYYVVQVNGYSPPQHPRRDEPPNPGELDFEVRSITAASDQTVSLNDILADDEMDLTVWLHLFPPLEDLQ